MGAKAFEQSAGFLRIPDGKNPLDNSAVHPESYAAVEEMAKSLDVSVEQLIGNEELISQIKPGKFINSKTGLPTVLDIIDELKKPGRDPRKPIKLFEFAKDVFRMEDLQPGMVLPGIVNNITKFGAFVDIGVKQSGLVHLSEMADRFISEPGEIVRLHQHVMVRILDVDISRKRIQLSLKNVQEK
jgi:uncharacterized protein